MALRHHKGYNIITSTTTCKILKSKKHNATSDYWIKTSAFWLKIKKKIFSFQLLIQRLLNRNPIQRAPKPIFSSRLKVSTFKSRIILRGGPRLFAPLGQKRRRSKPFPKCCLKAWKLRGSIWPSQIKRNNLIKSWIISKKQPQKPGSTAQQW